MSQPSAETKDNSSRILDVWTICPENMLALKDPKCSSLGFYRSTSRQCKLENDLYIWEFELHSEKNYNPDCGDGSGSAKHASAFLNIKRIAENNSVKVTNCRLLDVFYETDNSPSRSELAITLNICRDSLAVVNLSESRLWKDCLLNFKIRFTFVFDPRSTPTSAINFADGNNPRHSAESASSHRLRAMSDFERLFMNESLADAVVIVGEKKFYVNKAVLAIRSPALGSRLVRDGDDAEGKRQGPHDAVQISDAEPDIFEEFLRFLYTGELAIDTADSDKVRALLAVAIAYDQSDLIGACVDIMIQSIDLENVAKMFELAKTHNLHGLLAKTTELVCTSASYLLQNIDLMKSVDPEKITEKDVKSIIRALRVLKKLEK